MTPTSARTHIIVTPPHRVWLRFAAALLPLLFVACATRTPAPIVERSPAPPLPPLPGTIAITPPGPSPVPEPDWRPPTYTVKRGDTLQAIALDYGLDYRDLVAWNNIENPNLIRVGQMLRLRAPGDASADPNAAGVTTAPLRSGPPLVSGDGGTPLPPIARNPDNYKSHPKALKEPYSEKALREVTRLASAESVPVASGTPPITPGVPIPAITPMAPVASTATPSSPAGAAEPAVVARADPKAGPKPEPKVEPKSDARAPDAKSAPAGDGADDKIDWLWPASGKIVTGFSDTGNLKGIDIAGKAGQPVVASAAGKVVYAGTGLRGYGKLVIVKHNNTYLSAYAHNRDLLVKEGQQVTRGQKIAEMGNTDSDEVKLHFEIRKLGKPVDPLKYLPPA
jgi:lipoprotein NlpD